MSIIQDVPPKSIKNFTVQDLLERFNSDKPASKVKFDRRRAALDSDED